jgi:ribA/ribD-fused uncharacterized protein
MTQKDTSREINGFFGEFRFLSNFYPALVIFEGRVYPTVEHAYQAAKTLDDEARKEICYSKTPKLAKHLGYKAKLREDWNTIKVSIMRELLEKKFSTDEFRRALDTTKGFKLIERNNWGDVYWGVCNGVGENTLGKLLMEIRDG